MEAGVWIETSRLILRTVTAEDIEQVAQNWNLEGGPIPCEEAERRVQWMLDNHRQNAPGKVYHLCLAIADRQTGEMIGWCGLDHRDPARPAPVLFYLLKPGWRGKGLAAEAARALLDFAFQDLALTRVDGAAAQGWMRKAGMFLP